MLINDPPIPDPNRSDQSSTKKCSGGRAMTLLRTLDVQVTKSLRRKARLQPSLFMRPSRRRIRIRSCARVGRRRNFELDAPDKNTGAVSVRSWITLDVAKKLLADCGQDFEALKKSAISKDFRPVSLEGEGELRYQAASSFIPIAQCYRQTGRQRSEVNERIRHF